MGESEGWWEVEVDVWVNSIRNRASNKTLPAQVQIW